MSTSAAVAEQCSSLHTDDEDERYDALTNVAIMVVSCACRVHLNVTVGRYQPVCVTVERCCATSLHSLDFAPNAERPTKFRCRQIMVKEQFYSTWAVC